jgi:hypothetical protein
MHRTPWRLLALLPLATLLACGETDKADEDDGDGDTDADTDTDTDTDTDAVITDADHDGHSSDVDCDDNDYTVHPGAEELCDGVDNNCDGAVDEGFDADGDGATDAASCEDGTDCDDADATICPGCDEVPYDEIDQDCDGADLTDADGDGFDATQVGGADCDDGDATISPGAEEVAKDGVDQDCDGLDLLDGDGDGYDDEDFGGDDCDDADPAVSPGAFDFMNDEVDADCDGRDGRALALIDAPVTIDGGTGRQEYTGSGVALCDIDDDGLDDLVVSAPLLSATTNGYEGAIGIWYGADAASWSAGMAMSTADTLIWGDTYAFLGLSTVCADIDGDGYVDIVSSTGEYGPFGSEFSLAIWAGGGGTLGATLGMSDAEAVIAYPLGTSTADGSGIYSNSFAVQDLDGDGAGELIMLQAERTWSGDVAGAGDGALWILPGQARSGDLTLSEDTDHAKIFPDQDGALSSWSVSEDLDGDGDKDLFIGQGGYLDDPDAEEPVVVGRASFVSGWPAADDTVHEVAAAELTGDGTELAFGWQAATGDFDGDGAVDVLVSGITRPYGGAEDAGGLYLLSDAAAHLTGLGIDGVAAADADVQGQWGEGFLGSRLLTVGDMDGDGADDVLVREPGGGSGGTGRIRVVSGALLDGTGLNVDDLQLLELRAEDALSSTGIANATGDVDGDGIPDLVVAARTWGTTSSGGSATGRVYVYLSSTLGITP